MKQTDYSSCRKRALWYLSRYACTRKRLVDYLTRKGCGEHAERIAEELSRSGLINEELFGQTLVLRYGEKYGPAVIRQKLVQRGFSPADADSLIRKYLKKDEYEVIVETLNSRRFKTREQMIRFLLRRGFSAGAVIRAVNEFEKLTHTDE